MSRSTCRAHLNEQWMLLRGGPGLQSWSVGLSLQQVRRDAGTRGRWSFQIRAAQPFGLLVCTPEAW